MSAFAPKPNLGVRINGEIHYLWRAVDLEGEILEVQNR